MYAAEVAGRRLTFEVFGVWRKNMVMRDRETGTIWQQATGEALDGELKGRQLEALFAEETTWGARHAVCPQARFAVAPERHGGLIPKAMLMRMLGITRRLEVGGLSGADRRLDAHELIVGLVVNGEARAYPLALLRAAHVVHDRLGGQDITLVYERDGDRVRGYAGDGTPLLCERQWWLGWSEFHPRTSLLTPHSSGRVG